MMSASHKTSRMILVLALCFTTMQAQACGEVMYRMGGALRYRAFITHHPANILVYIGPSTLAHASTDNAKFHDNLEHAGHKVTLIKDEAALAKALATQSYDVVITYAGDVDLVTSQLTKVQREPVLIPVLDRNAKDEKAMRERFPQLVSEDANLNQFLKVIEQSMKVKGA
jgi:hypothetical protein